MQLQGTLTRIGTRTSKEYNGQTYWQQRILVEIPGYQDRVNTIPLDVSAKLQDNMDQYQEGMKVTAHYDYKGTGYTNKNTGEPDAFLSLQCWRLDKDASAQPQSNNNAAVDTSLPLADTENLPF